MQPLDCRGCGNHVLVKKYSYAHTSVQWTETNRCAELAPTDLTERALLPGCSQLRESIDEAVRAGVIEVPDQ